MRVNYSKVAPSDYRCSDCGTARCKLWRQDNMPASEIRLLCVACACKDQDKPDNVAPDGRHSTRFGYTDQIGSLIPAVPIEDGSSYWGYGSVPQAGVDWWKRLPTRR